MKILVVDDKQKNLDAAKQQLSGEHEVITCPSFVYAAELFFSGAHITPEGYGSLPQFRPPSIDAALLDLFMPGEPQGAYGRYGSKPLCDDAPYGLVLALRALQCEVKFVAIATDVDHHAGELPAALDLLFNWRRKDNQENQPLPFWRLGEGRLFITPAPLLRQEEGVKDWAWVLRCLLAGEILRTE